MPSVLDGTRRYSWRQFERTAASRFVLQFVTAIGAIGEGMTKPGKRAVHRLQQLRHTSAILHIGRMHNGANQQSNSVGENMQLAAFTCLPAS